MCRVGSLNPQRSRQRMMADAVAFDGATVVPGGPEMSEASAEIAV
jgi:hypothetical protein